MTIQMSSQNHRVKFSTGAGENLFVGLATLAQRLAQAGDDDNAAVVEWLSSYAPRAKTKPPS